jgi:hypothetical protein
MTSVADRMVEALIADVPVQSAFTTIEHSWTSEPTEIESTTYPAILVWPNNHVMAENTHDLIVSNMVAEQYNVLIVCDHADLTDRIAEERAVLHGWQYPDNLEYDLMELLGGEIVQLNGNVIWWMDTWFCRVQLIQTL